MKNWISTTLGELRYRKNKTVTPSKSPDQVFELYSIPAYDHGVPEVVHGSDIGSSKQIVASQSVLLSKINPRINRVWIVDNVKNYTQIASTEWIAFPPIDGVVPKFVMYFMKQACFKNFLAQNVSGVGGSLMRIKPATLQDYPIQIPPLPEQHRIVAKIEELFSDLDDGIASLKKAREQLKTYRQSVLKAAFEGKLTEAWRKEHQPPPAGELLAQIKAEREKQYLAACEKAKKEGGRKPKKPTELPPISDEERAGLPVLPEGWEWIKFGKLIEVPKYGTAKKCSYDATGIPVLRIPNIGDGVIDRGDLKYAAFTDAEKEQYSLCKDDLLIIRSNGSLSLVGKCAVVRDCDKGSLFAGYLVRLRVNNKSIHPTFLLYDLQSGRLRSLIESVARSTSGVNNINTSEIQNLTVAVCSKDEQECVIRIIEEKVSEIDALACTLKQALKQSDVVRQSILKKAFEGRLVSHDSTDGSAEKLLVRIKSLNNEVKKTTRLTGKRT